MTSLSKQARGGLPRTLITGATSGIGLELALQLAAAGVPVVALGRDRERLQALAGRSPRIDIVHADLARTDELPALAEALLGRHPDLGCVVHNAGVQNDVALLAPGSDAGAVAHEVAVNLVAPMVLTQLLLPHLLAQPGAAVVNVTSSLAYVPKRTAAVYSATKAGLRLFTEALRVQVAGRSLRVVEVVLPLVDTPMTAGRGRHKMPAAQAAREIVEGLQRGRPRVLVGRATALMWLVRWWPAMAARVLQRD